jgi:hypothetical protein
MDAATPPVFFGQRGAVEPRIEPRRLMGKNGRPRILHLHVTFRGAKS